MSRSRNIKPGFFDNEELSSLPMGARLLFIGLWTLADREGRLEDRPRKIRAVIFPYERDIDVDPWLDDLSSDEGEFLIRYEVDGKRYIQIRNFHRHQSPHHMETPSEIPPAEGYENKFNHRPIGKVQRERILKRDGMRCVKCNATNDLAIDHIVPVSSGGSSEDTNLRVLCGKCNGKKGARPDDESISTREFIDVKSNKVPDETLIPDSLIASSLNPDSLNPDVPIKPKKRASRFTSNEIPVEFTSYASDELRWDDLRISRTFEDFRDHWLSAPDSKGLKVDWLATWRKWCRSPFQSTFSSNGAGQVLPRRETATEASIRVAMGYVATTGRL